MNAEQLRLPSALHSCSRLGSAIERGVGSLNASPRSHFCELLLGVGSSVNATTVIINLTLKYSLGPCPFNSLQPIRLLPLTLRVGFGDLEKGKRGSQENCCTDLGKVFSGGLPSQIGGHSSKKHKPL